MKPTLTEQLAYCNEWIWTHRPVEWPSMRVLRISNPESFFYEAMEVTRGHAVEVNASKAYEKAIRPGHWSVLEFSWYCYAVTGVSRICTHELVRHRCLSYSQESTRAVGGSGVVIIPSGIDEDEHDRYLELLATKSSILVAGNGRAWAEMLRKRLCLRAAPEIRYLAYCIAKDLAEISPLVFACAAPDCNKCEESNCG